MTPSPAEPLSSHGIGVEPCDKSEVVVDTAVRRRGDRGGRKRGLGTKGDGAKSDTTPADGSPDWITTVMITGIPVEYTPQDFKEQLDLWGLLGCYNLFLMPADKVTNRGYGHAFVNFIDPAFAMLCQWLLYAWGFPGSSATSETQGLGACMQLAGVYAANKNMTAPVAIISDPVPSQWAVNVTNQLLSPQFRGQFRKTKMCTFFRKGRCNLDTDCPFAHSMHELQEMPDLSHTKLCYNHFRGKCTDDKCKYAHGSHKLRTVKALEQWNFDLFDTTVWSVMDFEGAGWPMMGCGTCEFTSSREALTLLSSFMTEEEEEAGSEKEGARSSDSTSSAGGSRGLIPGDDLAGDESPKAVGLRPRSKTGEVFEGIRERGTFMEALQVKDEEPMTATLRRSWSDSDLPAFRVAMESTGHLG